MSAPEDSTATAQPAPDHHHHHLHHHHHHQQNVVSAAATASASSASSATVVAGATAVPAPTNTGPPTAATATLSVPAAPAADIVTGSGASASTTLPAIKAGGNSSHATILTTTSHSKEVDGGTATNPAAQDGSNAAPGVVGPSDATDATSSCDSDKAPAAAAAAAAAIVTSSPPGADEGAAAATSDSFASVEVGSTGGTSTPLAAASPASLTGGDIGGPKPLPLSGCGSLMVAGSSSIVVPNGEGGDSNPNVPVLSGTATTIPLRGRDVTDKHAVDYHYRMLEEELQAVKESEAKIKQQYSESQRRERILARRVAVQEQEMRDFSKQIAELKSAQAPGPAALRSALLDPAVNILFQKLKAELQATKAKLEETQNELSGVEKTFNRFTSARRTVSVSCRTVYWSVVQKRLFGGARSSARGQCFPVPVNGAVGPLPLSGCGSLMVAGSSSIVVPNGEGGDSNPNVPVLSGTATTIPLRGRDVTDKHAVDYHYRMLEEELQAVKESEAKIKQQYSESQRRERILARRVAVQEQEMRDFSKQIAELKSAQAPGPAALRSALLDPAVNILFQKLKAELQATKAKLEETQNELSAWKFTPDSNTGKRLMAKCRLLYQENEELGKMTSNGRLAKLESELALQKSYNEEVKKSQLELDDFLQELDEDVEGMQGTIVFLQQELKQTKDARNEIEKEVIQLRAYIAANLGPFSGSGNNPTSGSTPTDERSSSMMMMMDVQDSNSNSNSHGHDAYHHPDGGGPDSIGGRGVRLGELGGGVTPIYLVNGGGGGGAGAGGASSSSGGTVIDAASRLVNKSSSSGDDQDLMVYSNRTHCGGVVTNSNELRTTPTTGAAGALPAAASVATAAAVSSLSALLPGSVPDPGIGGGGSSANSNTATVNGGAAGSGGEPLVNELHDSLVPSEGTRTSGGNTDSNSGGNVADTGNSVNSTNSSSSSSSSLAVAKQPHQPQQQQQQPQQPQQQRTNNNVGRNGGRTTVAARKRNYNETEVDSAEQTDGGSGGGVVSSSDAYRSESGVDGVLVMDVGVAESSATSGVANGKLAIADGSLLPEQQQDVESSNSNKRMTRSGKGKAAAATTTTISSSSTSSSSSSSSSSAASNVLMTSAAKKLRRGSIAPDDEVDPLADPQPSPQQQPQQPISSANGSN
uniref:Pre-mRNA-splicing regulator WTAP n=1 Tax=Anopheles gambiae TaxID=7165 RepID=A0A1S4H8Z2_ANOGA